MRNLFLLIVFIFPNLVFAVASQNLIQRAKDGDLDGVRTALDAGANVNQADDEGCTALIFASFEGHLEIVRILLDKGADVNQADNEGFTALGNASFKEHQEIVRVLLDKGADIDQADKDGNTALIIASFYGHLEAVRFLLENGANVYARNLYRGTALGTASIRENTETVKILKRWPLQVEQARQRAKDFKKNLLLIQNRIGFGLGGDILAFRKLILDQIIIEQKTTDPLPEDAIIIQSLVRGYLARKQLRSNPED